MKTQLGLKPHTVEEAIKDNADSLLTWGLVKTRPGGDNWQREGNDLGIKSRWKPHTYPAIEALGMILTGRHVLPDEGKELGFVNEVVPHDELMNVARKWAEMICQCAPLSIRASKDVVYRSLDSASLEESMKTQYDSVLAMRDSEDFIEGPKAFAEKRPPNWQGK